MATKPAVLPNTSPLPAALAAELEQLRKGHRFVNRLALETSPYLQQHAHNPVNWYPWGDEAFAAAKALNQPVLLSVGYSTCHWCHVMEEESFENEAIAAYMNAHYVCIKVDREERPDVDSIYMSALQMITQHGGWPMNMWLDHARSPFFGGTYFPPQDSARGPGFLTVLEHLATMFANEQGQVREAAADITSALHDAAHRTSPPAAIDAERVLGQALEVYRQRFDNTHGGMAGAPKFPSSFPVRLLLRRHAKTGDEQLLTMALATLKAMAHGGIYDQLAGGFHRYATDSAWLVPHFEKMLYDNALLVCAYLDAWQITHDSEFLWVAEDVLAYVAREMTTPDGAFFSATDADSMAANGKREEGEFFVWTTKEFRAVLGGDSAEAEHAFGVTAGGNWEGRTILTRTALPPEKARHKLYEARAKRSPPRRDDKVLAAWNGLMVSAFARAALVTGRADYLERAQRAAHILLEMRDGDRLIRTRGTRTLGFLDDYASVIAAFLDLAEASGDVRWLTEAITLQGVLDRDFADPAGGYFMTSTAHEALLVRDKPGYDGAEPSGNSIAAMNLLRLHAFTLREAYRTQADALIRSFASVLQRQPTALSEMLLAIDVGQDTMKEIVLVKLGDKGSDKGAEALMQVVRSRYLRTRALVVGTPAELKKWSSVVPWAADRPAQGGAATAYVCEAQVCQRPVGTPEAFAAVLQSH